LALSAFCLALAGCKKEPARDTLERARAEKRMRVGFANEAPFAYRDAATGRLTGEAPEVARHVLGRLGVSEVEGVLTEFGSLIPGLKAGRFDLIAAGMYITPERCHEVVFSEPSYCVRESLMVKRGNPENLHSYADVVKKSVVLGVVAGTVERGYAQALGVPEHRLSVFPDPPSAVAGLQAGRIQAYAGTSLTVADLLQKAADPTLEAARPFEDPVIDGKPARGCGAFAFRKRDTALRDSFDRELTGLLGTDTHAKLVSPFGFGEHTRVRDVRRSDLCAAVK
jgi:polar amino acid transport system substrate-binding protein